MEDVMFNKLLECHPWVFRGIAEMANLDTIRIAADDCYENLAAENRELLHDRLVGNLTYGQLATKYGISSHQTANMRVVHIEIDLAQDVIKYVDRVSKIWCYRSLQSIKSVPVFNALWRRGLRTFGDYANKTCSQLLRYNNLGVRSLEILADLLVQEAGDEAEDTVFMKDYKGGNWK